jgi:hypothetical protein
MSKQWRKLALMSSLVAVIVALALSTGHVSAAPTLHAAKSADGTPTPGSGTGLHPATAAQLQSLHLVASE